MGTRFRSSDNGKSGRSRATSGGNLIKQISAGTITADGATVIDGGGGTLMPGIIEAHGHLSLAAASAPDLLTVTGYPTAGATSSASGRDAKRSCSAV